MTEERRREFFGEQFSKRLKEWMEKNGKTQNDFRAEICASKNIITEWKKGRRFPHERMLKEICRVLEVDRSVFEASDDQLIKIRDELFDLLRECASRVWEMKDGSSEAFLLGADYGYNDAAAAVYNYLNEKIKER